MHQMYGIKHQASSPTTTSAELLIVMWHWWPQLAESEGVIAIKLVAA
jgi:hypothetical protein